MTLPDSPMIEWHCASRRHVYWSGAVKVLWIVETVTQIFMCWAVLTFWLPDANQFVRKFCAASSIHHVSHFLVCVNWLPNSGWADCSTDHLIGQRLGGYHVLRLHCTVCICQRVAIQWRFARPHIRNVYNWLFSWYFWCQSVRLFDATASVTGASSDVWCAATVKMM